ncbi:MAG: MltA domain-containing protein [Alphaproteobacteria bacterium GM202ARS2]|nr:MltA domain-containing protein [Alphaproteobacteria bacterium GM202ARS2]
MMTDWRGVRHYVRTRSFWRWCYGGSAVAVAVLLGWGLAQRHVAELEPTTQTQRSWHLQATTFDALGAPWHSYQEWQGAWRAFLASCSVRQRWRLVTQPETYDFLPVAARTPSLWQRLCRQAEQDVDPQDSQAIRAWLETYLLPYRFVKEGNKDEGNEGLRGLFTGYFRPILLGSARRTEQFPEPIYGVPSDLVVIDSESFVACEACPPSLVGQLRGRRVVPYPSRGDIMAGAIDGVAPVLAWAQDDIDVFVLSVQGSGKVRLTDGTTLVLRYAARNGHTYKSLGRILKQRGLLWHEEPITWPKLRQWLEDNPTKRRSVLADNPLYIFFEEAPDDIGAVGSLGVPLVDGHALAVDTRFIPLGLPLWVTTTHPLSTQTWSQLMMAQDTGSAVKGVVRGDIFWGEGAQAEISAGLMNYQGDYVILLPNPSAPSVTSTMKK